MEGLILILIAFLIAYLGFYFADRKPKKKKLDKYDYMLAELKEMEKPDYNKVDHYIGNVGYNKYNVPIVHSYTVENNC